MLYCFTAKEMRRLGAQDGEIAIFSMFGGRDNCFHATGVDGELSGQKYYAYQFDAAQPTHTTDLSISSRTEDGLETLTVHSKSTLGSAEGEPYRFEREARNNLLVQVGGPAKPLILGNFGSRPLRVNTISGGKFTVPCGMIRRLEGTGNRPKKKVLLTFAQWDDDALTSEVLGTDGSWRKLNITDRCGLWEVSDDGAIVAQIKHREWKRSVTLLERLEKEPDYDVYLRRENGVEIRRYAMRLVDGLPGYGEVEINGLEPGTVYDFGKLRAGMAPEQCATVLPNVCQMPECDSTREKQNS